MKDVAKGGRQPFQFQLDLTTGVPVYRQIIDQVLLAIASGTLTAGAQLPTVRQVAVDLSINPNTVVRAYRELEIRGIISTQQGTGTFITPQPVQPNDVERRRQLAQTVADFLARAAAKGFSMSEIAESVQEFIADRTSSDGRD